MQSFVIHLANFKLLLLLLLLILILFIFFFGTRLWGLWPIFLLPPPPTVPAKESEKSQNIYRKLKNKKEKNPTRNN